MMNAKTIAKENMGIYSDTYKSAYGIRPRGILMENFLDASIQEQENMFKNLYITIEQNEELYALQQGADIEAFKRKIQDMIELGASNETQAIHWIIESGDINQDEQDFYYEHGIEYTDYSKTLDAIVIPKIRIEYNKAV